jgi:hypothetical protein
VLPSLRRLESCDLLPLRGSGGKVVSQGQIFINGSHRQRIRWTNERIAALVDDPTWMHEVLGQQDCVTNNNGGTT